jgi:CheY-like chemotaxis protein
MKELIEWLARTEHMSSRIYRSAAEIFKKDQKLAPLLNSLAKDEEWHFQIMNRAGEVLAGQQQQPQMLSNWISLNKEKLEAPFLEAADKITKGILTRDDLLGYLVAGEFSEYNLIFLYVINSLKYADKEFAYAASKMELHKKSIEDFLKSSPGCQNYVRQIKVLPKVWNVTLLVVDDYEPMRKLLADILDTEGIVETAESGNTGLEKVKNNFYDIILTDMATPADGGIQFYNQAVLYDALVSERFLFLLNTPTEKELDFVMKNHIDYLEKPFSIEEIRKTVHEILTRPPGKLREAI